jgi:hypothetical protein
VKKAAIVMPTCRLYAPLIEHGYCEEEKRNTKHENKFKEDVGQGRWSGVVERTDVLAGL